MNDLAKRTSQRNNPTFRFSRHMLFNLSRPQQSLLLLAPLSKESGGHATCKAPVFTTTEDADYRQLLLAIQTAKRHLDKIKRFDMPGFRPSPHYVREMKRYAILPEDHGPDDPIDVYETDRAYWRSLEHRPGGE